MANEQSTTGGRRLTIRQASATTDGDLLELEARYPPHSPQPPAHYHPCQEERFQVLQGRFRARIGSLERVYETGETFIVPINTRHWMHNVSAMEGCLLWQVRPALRTQDFLETLWGLQADGKTNAGGVPNMLQLAVILHEYADECRSASPPYAVQCVLFGILAPVGRLLGYRPRYDRYCKETP